LPGEATHGCKDVSITLAAEQHFTAIQAIERQAATMFSEADLPLHLRHRVTSRQDLRQTMQAQRLWIAKREGDRVAGFAAASIVDGHGFLDEIDVSPQDGRQGVGTQLVSQVIAWSNAMNLLPLRLITFRYLEWNAPFYERLGFRPLGHGQAGKELRVLLDEERVAGLDMSKRVVMQHYSA